MAEKTELYKKYRPRKWSEMIGQDKVVRSLQSAIVKDEVLSAYLFAGTHGSGKTTAALILAKAVNCENIQEKGNPCNECSTCIAIDSGNQIGINYVSMANFNGVEGVRDIVEKARLSQPVKRQVWILDEVHNLSKQAFDALLIPLEQDNNFLFIFCTTEINKIPKTILSRIQQRKFNTVDPTIMFEYMKQIMDKEGVAVEDETVMDAVRQGRGSVRDTFTYLEAIMTTGATGKDYGTQILEALAAKNAKEVLKITAAASNDGVDFRLFGEQLFEDMRDLVLSVHDVDESLVVFNYPNPKGLFKKFISYTVFYNIMENVGETITKMASGADTRILLETSLIKNINYMKKEELKRKRQNNG